MLSKVQHKKSENNKQYWILKMQLINKNLVQNTVR